MIACTSPGRTARSTPRRIGLPPTVACRSFTSSITGPSTPPTARRSANAALQADAEQLLRLHRELHGQLLEHLLAEAVHDHVDGVLRGETALLEVEDLVLADLRGGGLVLHLRGRVQHLDVGEGVRAALVAEQQRVALRVVARVLRVLADADEAAVGVL